MKIGVLGGTFDPIHNGHLAIAREASARLGLDGVLFVPASHPPLKGTDCVMPLEHRLEMVRLAIAGESGFRLSTIEAEREGLSYTDDTLADLRKTLAPEDELFFIIGWDNLAQFPRWRKPARIIDLCRLVAVPRPGYPLPDLDKLEAEVPGLKERVIVLDGPEVDISATEIRDRLARGQAANDLLPGPVVEYIKEKGLYLNTEG